jgi:pimeloyl-ACP methyl ester carboxylesterase
MQSDPKMPRSVRRLAIAALLVTSVTCESAQSATDDRSHLDSAAALIRPCARPETSHPGVSIVRLTLGTVPAILRIPARIARPPIILWHGFGSPSSESELMEALPLDEIAAVKVYLGLPLFGARTPTNPNESLANRQSTDFASLLFAPAVLGAADELPSAVQALVRIGCHAAHQSIGLFGFSAGGTAALVALAGRKVALSAVVTLNAPIGLTDDISALERATGKSYQWTAEAHAIAAQADVINRAPALAAGKPPAALLQIRGTEDSVVSGDSSLELDQLLRPLYQAVGSEKRLQLLTMSGMTHHWTEGVARSEIRTAVASWFSAHLPYK